MVTPDEVPSGASSSTDVHYQVTHRVTGNRQRCQEVPRALPSYLLLSVALLSLATPVLSKSFMSGGYIYWDLPNGLMMTQSVDRFLLGAKFSCPYGFEPAVLYNDEVFENVWNTTFKGFVALSANCSEDLAKVVNSCCAWDLRDEKGVHLRYMPWTKNQCGWLRESEGDYVILSNFPRYVEKTTNIVAAQQLCLETRPPDLFDNNSDPSIPKANNDNDSAEGDSSSLVEKRNSTSTK